MIVSRNHNRMHAAPGRRRWRRHRRGSVYILVLCLGMILCAIGVALTTAGRAGNRSLSESCDWAEAETLAIAGSEHAMCQINRVSNWRTAYSGVTVQNAMGRGTFSWQVNDGTGGNTLSSIASNPFVILATGTVGRASYTLWVHMLPSGGGVTAGVTVNGAVTLSGNGYVDSFNSTSGAYGGSNVGSQALVQTNTTASGGVSLASNAMIRGSLQIGPGGNANQVVTKSGNGTITGTVTPETQAIQMPTVSAPSGLGSSTGDISYAGNGTTVISGNVHVGNLTIGGNQNIQISGNVTILADGNVSTGGNTSIEILPNSSLSLYFNGSLSMSGNSKVDGQNLSRMQLLNLGSGTTTLSGNTIFYGAIISPNGAVTLSGNATVYGAVVAQSLSLSPNSNAAVHQDTRITSQVDPVSLGSSTPVPNAWTRVVN